MTNLLFAVQDLEKSNTDVFLLAGVGKICTRLINGNWLCCQSLHCYHLHALCERDNM